MFLTLKLINFQVSEPIEAEVLTHLLLSCALFNLIFCGHTRRMSASVPLETAESQLHQHVLNLHNADSGGRGKPTEHGGGDEDAQNGKVPAKPDHRR